MEHSCRSFFVFLLFLFQEVKRVFEQNVGRLRAELAGDKEAALSALRRETDEELQVLVEIYPVACTVR